MCFKAAACCLKLKEIAVQLDLEAQDARHNSCKVKIREGHVVQLVDNLIVYRRETGSDDQDLIEFGDWSGRVGQLKGGIKHMQHEELGRLNLCLLHAREVMMK